MRIERVKENDNISITTHKKSKGVYELKAYDFLTSKVIYRQPFRNAKDAITIYEDLTSARESGETRGLRGRIGGLCLDKYIEKYGIKG